MSDLSWVMFIGLCWFWFWVVEAETVAELIIMIYLLIVVIDGWEFRILGV